MSVVVCGSKDEREGDGEGDGGGGVDEEEDVLKYRERPW